MKMLITALAALCLCLGAHAEAEETQSAVDDVVAAERAFDALTFEKGFTRGFHDFAAPGAIGFYQGQMIDFKSNMAAALEGKPEGFDAPSQLRWGPGRIGVSESGDFAYDLGVWRSEGNNETGWFFTIWQKLDGQWLYTLDMRAGYANPGEIDFAAPVVIDAKPTGPVQSVIEAEDSVRTIDTAFNEGLEIGSLTLPGYIAPDGVFSRTKGAPTGHDSLPEVLAERPQDSSYGIARTLIAPSGDMACTIGIVTAKRAVVGHYVRLWRRDGGVWRIVTDIFAPA